VTRAIIPTFYDMGAAGFWRDMLANSPRLRVSDYEGARQHRAGSPGAEAPVHSNAAATAAVDTPVACLACPEPGQAGGQL
jgi:hypothetical protein